MLRLSLRSMPIWNTNISGSDNEHELADTVQSKPQPRLTQISRLLMLRPSFESHGGFFDKLKQISNDWKSQHRG